jgi:hypothetical protein
MLDAKDLACSWFDSKKRAAKLVCKFQMDEAAIEAEAFESCFENVERLDQMLTALEFRRDRTLRFIAEYREIPRNSSGWPATTSSTMTEVPRLVAVGKRSG